MEYSNYIPKKRTMQELNEGHAWNPVRGWPPNAECFCKSGKKFKKCCRDKISRTCFASDVEKLTDAVKKALEEFSA